ncbi:peptidoglycan-binding protein [Aliiruegeria sabulilitoris]|uniref:peptidoglycan-binding protein n=1 Tax=Aliiruegeria sabulilitoris TaxID=1510458 RepID=UPI0013D5D65E|nr:peptidoglycan-binding protein [Aliiruegeria sabulilitoris]
MIMRSETKDAETAIVERLFPSISYCCLCLVSAIAIWAHGPALGQGSVETPESLLARASALVAATDAPYDAQEATYLDEARISLDRIVTDFPSSDIALRILMQDKIGNLDVAKLRSDVASLARDRLSNGSAERAVQTAENVAPSAPDGAASGLARGIAAVEFPLKDTPLPAGTSGEELNGLKQAERCFVPKAGLDPQEGVVIEVQIDPGGNVARMPELIDPSKPTETERNLVLSAITALDGCAPYGPDAAGLHRVSASTSGIRPLEFRALQLENAEEITNTANVLSSAESVVEAVAETADYWGPATVETYNALGLTRSEIFEVQARLTSMGYNVRGIDGLYGDGTRGAVSSWQLDLGLPVSGYLDRPQLALLREHSIANYTTWITYGIVSQWPSPPARFLLRPTTVLRGTVPMVRDTIPTARVSAPGMTKQIPVVKRSAAEAVRLSTTMNRPATAARQQIPVVKRSASEARQPIPTTRTSAAPRNGIPQSQTSAQRSGVPGQQAAPKKTYSPKAVPTQRKTAPKTTTTQRKTAPKTTTQRKAAPKKTTTQRYTAPKRTTTQRKTAPKKSAPQRKTTTKRTTTQRKTAPKKSAPQRKPAPKKSAPKRSSNSKSCIRTKSGNLVCK